LEGHRWTLTWIPIAWALTGAKANGREISQGQLDLERHASRTLAGVSAASANASSP
jgi:hypothetical protein